MSLVQILQTELQIYIILVTFRLAIIANVQILIVLLYLYHKDATR